MRCSEFYECNRCGYEFDHEPEAGEPALEVCPACLKPFRPAAPDDENEAA